MTINKFVAVLGVAAVLATGAAAPASAATLEPGRLIVNAAADPATGVGINFRLPSVASEPTVEVRQAGTTDVLQTLTPTRGAYMADLHYPWSTDVEGLESGTTYEFRVVSGEDASEWHSFTTADTSDRLDFLYFGDAQQGLTE